MIFGFGRRRKGAPVRVKRHGRHGATGAHVGHTHATTTGGMRTRRNPCRCKIVGPVVGLAAFAVAAVVEWPVGALVYIFKHAKGRRIMGHPATHVYPKVNRCFPI